MYRAKVDGVLLSFTSDIADGGRHIFSIILSTIALEVLMIAATWKV